MSRRFTFTHQMGKVVCTVTEDDESVNIHMDLFRPDGTKCNRNDLMAMSQGFFDAFRVWSNTEIIPTYHRGKDETRKLFITGMGEVSVANPDDGSIVMKKMS